MGNVEVLFDVELTPVLRRPFSGLFFEDLGALPLLPRDFTTKAGVSCFFRVFGGFHTLQKYKENCFGTLTHVVRQAALKTFQNDVWEH